ncbi:DUF1616 domain-containing protein [Candidatus Heimdallarchaeota archaeon]|nr:MAG: DUF1616 domain-containing protein [Candidatus Heimdallarchaeota archaeon]
MAEKKNSTTRDKREPHFDIVLKVVLAFAIIGIIVSSILMLTPPISRNGYSEIAILTYNESSDIYEANNYPTSINYNQTSDEAEPIELFLMVSNHHSKAKYFEVRVKIGLQSLYIDEESYVTNESGYFYNEEWKDKAISPDKTWGPSEDTSCEIIFNSTILAELGGSDSSYKIVFELWEWNTNQNSFVYTGLFTYLTSLELNILN